MKQIIIKIPSSTNLKDIEDEATIAIYKSLEDYNVCLLTQVAGSVVYNDEKLILILSDVMGLETLFTELGLDWSVIAVEGEEVDPDLILDFMPDVTELKSLHCASGHKWIIR